MNHHDIAWEDATVVDADPICTVAEHLMHGTSVSSMVHCHVFSFFLPARPFCFYISYQLYVPLLVFIVTDEDYCRVVRMFGYHILL